MGEATYGGALRTPLAGSPACVFVFVFVLIYVEFEFSPPPRPQPRFQGVKKNKSRKKRSVAKMKVQVMTINSVQKSSKSELSSGIFGHFKVWKKSWPPLYDEGGLDKP